jgi:hypothetical protein
MTNYTGTYLTAVPGSNTYIGPGGGAWTILDYRGVSGPITVNFKTGTVTTPDGTDTIENVDAIIGPSTGGVTIISADNNFGGVQLLPDGGDNTFIANGVPNTQDIFD